jgi:GT2 family glycosyltransferase
MREVDLSIVTYHPDFPLLERLLASLAEVAREPLVRNLFIHDNSGEPDVATRLEGLTALRPGGAFARVEVIRSATNVGFGRGHNANAMRGRAPCFFVLNQDCVLEPGVLEEAVAGAERDDARIAAWEMRQIPFEHPKEYDPVTLDTPWASGAALLLRRAAFDEVGGFEPRIFLYGEDVDLSWRLRARGWRVVYRPRLAVVHRTYEGGAVKPAQVFGSAFANLALRARYGGLARTFEGWKLLWSDWRAGETFPGRRRGLARAGLRFLASWTYFARTRVAATDRFAPRFEGRDYERRRDGAFHALPSKRDGTRPSPLVSILVRTLERPEWLRQALETCAQQTHRDIEVVVVEDGPERSRAVVDAFRGRLPIRYRATGANLGRARAGNLALSEARGEWLMFLDDDDLLFADHVEVLVDAALLAGTPGAYAHAWEVRTRVRESDGLPEEVSSEPIERQAFDRILLWHRNFLPIQSVLFHRRLRDKYGGFAEDMEQLEDWDLWTRYTLTDDFARVEKTTSKFRVPADEQVAAARQARLDAYYPAAVARQGELTLHLTPRHIAAMAQMFVRSEALAAMQAARDSPRSPRRDWLERLAGETPERPATIVRGERFTKRRVVLDAHEYVDCHFADTTFEYDGTTPISFRANRITRPFRLASRSDAVISTVAFLQGLGLLREAISVEKTPEPPR